MSYSFKPMSDEEINSFSLVDEGNYQFEVIKSTKKTSKSGNPMAELNIRYWDIQGKEHLVYDYLVFTDVPLNIKKISHFCKSVGLDEEYKRGEIPEDLQYRRGVLHLGVQAERPKGDGTFYPKKNVVLDYLKDTSYKSAPVVAANEPNDDIPF